MSALLVRGTDRYGHFDLYEPPVKELGEKELAVHDRVYNAYAENYREQVRRHEEEFAVTQVLRGIHSAEWRGPP